jgi:O-antigen/teichoic acid export membrane protein
VNAVNGILGMIAVPVGIAALGTSGYGLYSIYAVLVSFSALIDIGVGKNLARLLAADSRESSRTTHLQTALGLYLIFSVVLLVLLPLWYYLIPNVLFPVLPQDEAAIRSITMVVVLEYMLAVPTVLMQTNCVADERFNGYTRFIRISGLYRYGLLFIGFVVFKSPVIAVALVASRRLIDVIAATRLLGRLPAMAWKPRLVRSEVREMLGKSTVLSMAQIFQTLLNGAGSVLVNRHFGLETLGLFRSAFDIASKIWFFSNGLGLLAFPRFAKMLVNDRQRESLYRRINPILNSSWAAYNLVAMVGVFAAPAILARIGLGNPVTITLFLLLLLAISLNAHSNLSYEFLQASGRYSLLTLLNGAGLLLLVASFYVLRPGLGQLAIGWAWIVSQAIYGLASDFATFASVLTTRGAQLRVLILRLLILAGSVAGLLTYGRSLGDSYRIACLTLIGMAVALCLKKLLQGAREIRSFA